MVKTEDMLRIIEQLTEEQKESIYKIAQSYLKEDKDFTSEEIKEIRAGLKDIRNGDVVSEDDAGE